MFSEIVAEAATSGMSTPELVVAVVVPVISAISTVVWQLSQAASMREEMGRMRAENAAVQSALHAEAMARSALFAELSNLRGMLQGSGYPPVNRGSIP